MTLVGNTNLIIMATAAGSSPACQWLIIPFCIINVYLSPIFLSECNQLIPTHWHHHLWQLTWQTAQKHWLWQTLQTPSIATLWMKSTMALQIFKILTWDEATLFHHTTTTHRAGALSIFPTALPYPSWHPAKMSIYRWKNSIGLDMLATEAEKERGLFMTMILNWRLITYMHYYTDKLHILALSLYKLHFLFPL